MCLFLVNRVLFVSRQINTKKMCVLTKKNRGSVYVMKYQAPKLILLTDEQLILFISLLLLYLLEVGILDVLSLWTLLLSLLLTALELIATRLTGCTALLVHLL